MKRTITMGTGGAAVVFLAILLGSVLLGQQEQPPPPDAAPPPAQTLPPQQLEDLVAPIALYPDTLLSEILAASTYPLEVVEAQQWLQHNPNLKGKKLMEKAQHENWDPSVQALVAFPDVLARLNQDIRWTTDLGNAFLAQQQDVMAAVQRMRARAEANGKLQSGPQENVTTITQNGQSAIQILPPEPGTVYVPYYNPAWVWGPPVYGYYPPLLYPGLDVGFSFWPGVDLGFYFGGGWGLWGGLGWGWGPNWFGGGIFVDPFFFHRFGFRDFHGGFGGGNMWAHDPGHRLGVPYANRGVAQRFGGENFRGGEGFRGNGESFRGGNEGFRGNAQAARGGNESFRGNESARAPSERFGTEGFERQNQGGERSAFGGSGNGSFTRMQSDHGFSSMGHAGVEGGGFRGGGGGGGFGGGGHGGGRR
jgi:hypothetical protein